MHSLSEIPKNYLEYNGFVLKKKKAKFKFKIWADSIIAATYSIISIISVVMQNAATEILILNIFCLARAVLNNAISASEITYKIKCSSIENTCSTNNYYHTRLCVMGCAFAYTLTLLIFIIISNSKAVEIAYTLRCERNLFMILAIKFLTSASIFWVFVNDLTNNIIYAYDASIDPVERE